LLLVMLHTGTMFAVIAYFWKQWRTTYFDSAANFKQFTGLVVIATAITGVVGLVLVKLIEKTALVGKANAEPEELFSHLELIAPALAAAGVLILAASFFERRRANSAPDSGVKIGARQAGWIGFVQGLCLPFRGFSRSGATISTAMLAGVSKLRAETFSFALAVVLTPPVVAREALRLVKAQHISTGTHLAAEMVPGLIGACCAFLAGLAALRWLSKWLEGGRWYVFGIYCLAASLLVGMLHWAGY
jgi:undecaprenyl-diphosphatase